VIILFVILSLISFADWPQFRGPTGQGVSDERNLPLSWSETKNVRWKVEIPGRGWSSPVVQGDRIWLTTATEEGHSLRAIAVDVNSGTIQQNVEVFRLKSPKLTNGKNSFASPTPIVEGDRVYLHFGAYGTACITQSGEIVWKTKLEYDNGQHGPGGSPVLYDDLLIVSCDGLEQQFVIALDKATGKVRWKKMRETGYQAYSTPLIVSLPSGDQVISPGAFQAIAYEPRTGKEIWHVRYGEGFSNVPRPVYGNDMVFICSGFQEPSLLAVRVDGRGDVTKKIVWKLDRGIPRTPSPLLVGNELYIVNDNGIATCIDAKTGEELWRARLDGNYSASPIYADGRIYFLSEEGVSIVIAPGRQLKHLATNQLDGPTLASMAVSHNSLFIRSATHLYRISN
jgi:outer membrane protein assembly factor BamB